MGMAYHLLSAWGYLERKKSGKNKEGLESEGKEMERLQRQNISIKTHKLLHLWRSLERKQVVGKESEIWKSLRERRKDHKVKIK